VEEEDDGIINMGVSDYSTLPLMEIQKREELKQVWLTLLAQRPDARESESMVTWLQQVVSISEPFAGEMT
jgi:hypothetical protein